MKYFLKSATNWEIGYEYSSGEEFDRKIRTKERPDIILMDYQMPGRDGIIVTKKYLFDFPMVKVIAVTMHTSELFLIDLIEAGFKGCVQKQNLYKHIIPAINTVLNGGYYFNDGLKIIQ